MGTDSRKDELFHNQFHHSHLQNIFERSLRRVAVNRFGANYLLREHACLLARDLTCLRPAVDAGRPLRRGSRLGVLLALRHSHLPTLFGVCPCVLYNNGPLQELMSLAQSTSRGSKVAFVYRVVCCLRSLSRHHRPGQILVEQIYVSHCDTSRQLLLSNLSPSPGIDRSRD